LSKKRKVKGGEEEAKDEMGRRGGGNRSSRRPDVKALKTKTRKLDYSERSGRRKSKKRRFRRLIHEVERVISKKYRIKEPDRKVKQKPGRDFKKGNTGKKLTRL